MHTLNRILTALFTVIVLLPPATFALVSLNTRDQAQQSLQDEIGKAVTSYGRRGYVQSLLTKGQSMQEKGEAKIQSLEKQKLALRRAVVEQRGIISSVSKKYHLTLSGSGQVALLIEEEKRRLVRIVRANYFQLQVAKNDAPRTVIVRSMLHAAAGDRFSANDLQVTAMQFIADLDAAQQALQVLPALEQKREDVLDEYHKTSRQIEDGLQMAQRSDAQLAEIRQITTDVHDSVLRLQSELARIDAQLKSKAERALIEKGLIDPSTIAANHATPVTPVFTWPVYGPVSAGYQNADYKKFFGVPHLGMDIVVPQGSAVHSSADGVVFLVRDGGLTGYSYILIGHRGGYATLYGHVSQALVVAGQQVTAGQEIALSGGNPGTHGAGPMTTAAHLHFEVIQAGANVNPKSVLP